MGGSSRPRCTGAPRLSVFNGWCSAEPMNPTKATDFFIDSLEVLLFLSRLLTVIGVSKGK